MKRMIKKGYESPTASKSLLSPEGTYEIFAARNRKTKKATTKILVKIPMATLE